MRCSVALLTHNSEAYLREQIDSILLSLRPDDEIVISDDHSIDTTLKIIDEYTKKDKRIRFHENDKQPGPNGNCESAYSRCTGDIIFHSDDDNVWAYNKIPVVLKAFEGNPNVFMVMHDARIVDANLKQLHPSFFRWRNSKPGVMHNITKLTYGGSMIAFRKEMLARLLPFPKNMPFFFDAWVGFTADRHYKSLFIPDCLSLWRRHEGTTTGGPSRVNRTSNLGGVESKRKKKKGRLLSRLKILFFVMRH